MEIVGACKLMDGFFLGDAICAEVRTYCHFDSQTMIGNVGFRFLEGEQDNTRGELPFRIYRELLLEEGHQVSHSQVEGVSGKCGV